MDQQHREKFMQNTLKQLLPESDVIILQQLLSSNGYFEDIKPPHGLFDRITFDNVVLFGHLIFTCYALRPHWARIATFYNPAFRLASMKPSRSPSSTLPGSVRSTWVRRSFTRD